MANLPTLATASLGELASLACQQQQQQQQQQRTGNLSSFPGLNLNNHQNPTLIMTNKSSPLPGIQSLISQVKEPLTPSSSLAASPSSQLAFSPLLPLAAAGSPSSPQSQPALPPPAPIVAAPASTSPTFSALPTFPAATPASLSAFVPSQPQPQTFIQGVPNSLFANPAALMQYYMAYYQLLHAAQAGMPLQQQQQQQQQPRADLPSASSSFSSFTPALQLPAAAPVSQSERNSQAIHVTSKKAASPASPPSDSSSVSSLIESSTVPVKKPKRPTTEQLQQPSKKARLDPQGQIFSHVPHKRAYKHNPPPTMTKCCTSCGSNTTPEWRSGPKGPKTLCNACGLQFSKAQRANKDKVQQQQQQQPEQVAPLSQ